MSKIVLSDEFKNIFQRNRKCIVNADIDGILAGMFLQHFLNWRVVGYSSCCGKEDDELWLEDQEEHLVDCVFVDLPVIVKEYTVIDQHFVAFDMDSVDKYTSDTNKVNPNIMRKRIFSRGDGKSEYTSKYPFGTAHFVLAILENMGIINSEFTLDISKKLGNFDLADLILRADRVIGNTYQYNPNCVDWANWIIELGGKNTEALFVVVKKEYGKRILTEKEVEKKLISLGCKGVDGDCSNLFRTKDYDTLKGYFKFLSDSINLRPLPINNLFDFGKLKGKRLFIVNSNVDVVKKEAEKDNIFSYAFVTMRALSLTYLEEE